MWDFLQDYVKIGYMKNYDVIIAGGGASGLVSAITAKRKAPGLSVLIMEKNPMLGRKILSTGNGRCNLSNFGCLYHDEILDFFGSIGIVTRTGQDGRIYPYTEDAKDVREALVQEVEKLGVESLLDTAVKDVRFDDKNGIYIVKTGETEFGAADLVLALGGKAAPKLGTTGDGYGFAKKLYHSVTKLAPALTAVETHEDTKMLSGVRAKAKVSLIAGGGSLFEETGEVQFTDYGISGIAVFDMSRYMVIPEGRTLVNGFDDYSVEIDFLPGSNDVKKLVESGARVVRKPLREYIDQKANGDAEMKAWMLKHFLLHPKGLRGWDHAEITKGGVPLTELDTERMRSKFMPGLYFTGEIIDYDGPCGGFNLENAWETGMKAGKDIAEGAGK